MSSMRFGSSAVTEKTRAWRGSIRDTRFQRCDSGRAKESRAWGRSNSAHEPCFGGVFRCYGLNWCQIATPSTMIAAHSAAPSKVPLMMPRALLCGGSSGLRRSIRVAARRSRITLVSSSKGPMTEFYRNAPRMARGRVTPVSTYHRAPTSPGTYCRSLRP
jgi:hypothetical protein